MEKTILRIGNEAVCMSSKLPGKNAVKYKAHKLENAKASSEYDKFTAEKAIDGDDGTMMISTNEDSDWWSADMVGGKSFVEAVQIRRAGNTYLRAFRVTIDDKFCGQVPENTVDLWYTVKCNYAIEGKTIKIATTAKDSHFALYEVKAIEKLPEPNMLEDCTTAGKVSLTKEKTIKFEDSGKCIGVMKESTTL